MSLVRILEGIMFCILSYPFILAYLLLIFPIPYFCSYFPLRFSFFTCTIFPLVYPRSFLLSLSLSLSILFCKKSLLLSYNHHYLFSPVCYSLFLFSKFYLPFLIFSLSLSVTTFFLWATVQFSVDQEKAH